MFNSAQKYKVKEDSENFLQKMMTVYLPFVMSCFLSKLKRSINDITISVAQANSRVFTDWLKRLILMSKEESSRPKRSYQLRVIHRRGYRSHTSISQRSLGPLLWPSTHQIFRAHVDKKFITKIRNLSYSSINLPSTTP